MIRLGIVVITAVFLFGCGEQRERETEPQGEHNLSKKVKIEPKPVDVIDESQLKKRHIVTASLDDIYAIFKELGYTSTSWRAQKLEIPRLYLQRISCRWHAQSAKIPVKEKKAIFFQLITPAILRANELIQLQRNHILKIYKEPIDVEDEGYEWLMQIARQYKVIKKEQSSYLSPEQMEMLLRRVDTIPLSLALAQAAEESGWGTSRFAHEGNALFGQWTFGKDAMIPKEQRSELGNYGLKRFDTPQDSVNSYMRNLNTNNAYKKLRLKRQELRESGLEVTGLALAETLDKYSERGYAYVEGLKKMINYNKLAAFDRAYLWDKEVIYLKPKKVRKPSQKLPVMENNVTEAELLEE